MARKATETSVTERIVRRLAKDPARLVYLLSYTRRPFSTEYILDKCPGLTYGQADDLLSQAATDGTLDRVAPDTWQGANGET